MLYGEEEGKRRKDANEVPGGVGGRGGDRRRSCRSSPQWSGLDSSRSSAQGASPLRGRGAGTTTTPFRWWLSGCSASALMFADWWNLKVAEETEDRPSTTTTPMRETPPRRHHDDAEETDRVVSGQLVRWGRRERKGFFGCSCVSYHGFKLSASICSPIYDLQ